MFVCQATSANGLGGGNAMSSLSQLGQQLGQILQKLMSSSGSGSGSGSSAPTTASTCTTYTPTSDPTQIGVNPCVYYDPSAASALTTGVTATSTSAQDLLDALNGTSGTSTSSASLSASPVSGIAPLSVTFTTSPINSSETYTVDPGDGGSAISLTANGCSSTSSATCVYGGTYNYNTIGTYTATLYDANEDTLSTVSISVENSGGGTTPAAGGTTSGLTQILQSVGGLLAPTSSTTQTPAQNSSFLGPIGNILLNSNGATIFASTVNSANNSETSGFYGSNTFGGQPQGIAGQLCENRPWASNVLADFIPSSFFDGLCSLAGYQVGQPQTQTQPQVTLSQQEATGAQSAPQATTTSATTTSSVPPQAEIWAEPASVPLGARTSIFWNTQGVTACTESSPDGSFSENSLSGAQATVPITGATTFTISCTDPNGNPVTDDVIVELSS